MGTETYIELPEDRMEQWERLREELGLMLGKPTRDVTDQEVMEHLLDIEQVFTEEAF